MDTDNVQEWCPECEKYWAKKRREKAAEFDRLKAENEREKKAHGETLAKLLQVGAYLPDPGGDHEPALPMHERARLLAEENERLTKAQTERIKTAYYRGVKHGQQGKKVPLSEFQADYTTFRIEEFYETRKAYNKARLEIERLKEALALSKEALEHDAPGSCWATGPKTGDPIEDLVVCPGCRALHAIEKCHGSSDEDK